ncbi:MAG: molybdate ABC transporter substrate-binding protein [Alphaproteobacteria bacterium]
MPAITRRAFGVLASSSFLGTITGAPLARAADDRASDVVAFCEPTLQHLMENLGRLWRAQSGVPVRLFVTRSDIFLEQIWRGARCDLAIIEGQANLVAALRRNLVKPAPRLDGWRNRLVIAAYGESRPPLRLTPGSELAGFLGSAHLALADAALSPAGSATRAALEALGLWESLEGRIIGAENTGTVAFLLATGKAGLGVVQASDLAADPELKIAASFPDDAYPQIAYSVAQSQRESTAAPRFLAFLGSSDAQALVKAGGLEVRA